MKEATMNARNSNTLLIAALVIVVGTAAAAQAGDHSIRLTWLNASDAFTIPTDAIVEEVEKAFAPHDVAIAWDGDAAASRELRVMLLPVEPTVWNVPKNAMGITRGDVETTNTVYIFLPTVMRALGLEMTMHRMPTPMEKLEIAKALGRVVSHEVFHALIFGQPHSEHGLMREQLTKGSLSGGSSHFDDESAKALQEALAGL